jgi:hypothetical protein
LNLKENFFRKMLIFIPDLESNDIAIRSIVFEYSDMETYDNLSKNVVPASQDWFTIYV